MIHPSLHSPDRRPDGEGSSLRVVLLTGADRLSLDSVAFSLADSSDGACVVSYDVRADDDAPQGLDVVRTITMPADREDAGRARTESRPLDDCCLTCCVKHNAGHVMETLKTTASVFLVSLLVGVEATPVAQYLNDMVALGQWGDGTGSCVIANAVGLDEFEERFFDDDRLMLAGSDEDDGVFEDRSTGAVVSRLIHEAAHVLELPVIGVGCLAGHVDLDGGCSCSRIIRSIAGRGAVVHEDAHTVGLGDLVTCGQAVGC